MATPGHTNREELRSLKSSTNVVLLIRTKLNKALMRAAFKKLALLQLLKNKNIITKTLKEVMTAALGKSGK